MKNKNMQLVKLKRCILERDFRVVFKKNLMIRVLIQNNIIEN